MKRHYISVICIILLAGGLIPVVMTSCGDFDVYTLAGVKKPGERFLPSQPVIFFVSNGQLWKAPIPEAGQDLAEPERVYTAEELLDTDELYADEGSDAIYWSCGSKVYRYTGLRNELVVDCGGDDITSFAIDPNRKRLLIGLSGSDKDDIYESGLKPGSTLSPLNLISAELQSPFNDLVFDPDYGEDGTLFMTTYRQDGLIDPIISRLDFPGNIPAKILQDDIVLLKFLACSRANEILYYMDGAYLEAVNYNGEDAGFVRQNDIHWLAIKDMSYDEVDHLFYLSDDDEDSLPSDWHGAIKRHDPLTETSTIIHEERYLITAIAVYRP
ncbi:MAG: hypothetical protein JW881_00165 [Spirochaetales bacterium]|nr:hypothetical protein [Spirochaetales bacterium]